jgi:lipid-binding SYLF domain-containing protein
MVGFATIEQATIGLQAGGQNFAELIAFENEEAFNRFTSNRFEATAQASAVAIKTGAAAAAKYTNGVAIFTYVKGGLMAEASVGGQRFTFQPAEKR